MTPSSLRAASLVAAFVLIAFVQAEASADSRRGYTAGRASVPPGQPGRTLGQPTTGPAPERRAIGVDEEVRPLGERNPRELSPAPLSPSTTQFFGSGGRTKDGSIPGGSLVALDEGQRRKVREIILAQDAPREPSADFRIMVGAKVPESVPLRPIPPDAVAVVPQYRDFDFTVVGNRIVVVQRSTREIDTMIPF